MIRQLLAIALLNFREVTRDRLFAGVVFFLLFFFAFCVLLSRLSVGHTDKVMRDVGLAAIEGTAVFLIITSIIYRFFNEKNTRIMDVYLTDFERSVYIGGKYLGYFLIAVFYLFLCGLGFAFLLMVFRSYHPVALLALYPLLLKLFILIGYALIFSSFFSSSTIAALSCLFIYISSELAPSVVKIISVNGGPWQQVLTKALYFLLPNTDKLDLKFMAAGAQVPEAYYFISITVYGLIYTALLWKINQLIFCRKEYS